MVDDIEELVQKGIAPRAKDECWHLQHKCENEVAYPYICHDQPELYNCSKAASAFALITNKAYIRL